MLDSGRGCGDSQDISLSEGHHRDRSRNCSNIRQSDRKCGYKTLVFSLAVLTFLPPCCGKFYRLAGREANLDNYGGALSVAILQLRQIGVGHFGGTRKVALNACFFWWTCKSFVSVR
jgi:hypothetical protein